VENPVKIAFIIDQLIFAGAQRHILNLAQNIDRKRFIPYIVCLIACDSRIEEFCKNNDIKIFVLGISKIYGFKAGKKFFSLISWFKKEKINIVQTYLFASHIYATPAARLAGVKLVFSARRAMVFWNKLRYRICRIIVNTMVDYNIPNSLAVKQHISAREFIRDKKMRIIPNGVNTNIFSPVSPMEKNSLREKIGTSKYICGTVAQFLPVKGVDNFIEVAKRVINLRDDITFVIVGKGRQEENLKLMTKGFENKILFLGEKINIADFYRAFDLFMLLSESEGMSNALLEAMACGNVVFATNKGGNIDVIEDGKNGFLVNPKDYDYIAKKLQEVLSDNKIMSFLSDNSRKTISDKFSLDIMINNYQNLYQEFLEKK